MIDPFEIDPDLIPDGFSAQWVSLEVDPFVLNRGWKRLDCVDEVKGNILVIKPKEDVVRSREQEVALAKDNEQKAIKKMQAIAGSMGLEIEIKRNGKVL